jgi:hypothetical protein
MIVWWCAANELDLMFDSFWSVMFTSLFVAALSHSSLLSELIMAKVSSFRRCNCFFETSEIAAAVKVAVSRWGY